MGRLLEDMAEHAAERNAHRIKTFLTPLECDELWSFVKITTQVPKTTTRGLHYAGTIRDMGGYCTQIGNLTAEGRGGGING